MEWLIDNIGALVLSVGRWVRPVIELLMEMNRAPNFYTRTLRDLSAVPDLWTDYMIETRFTQQD